MNYEELLHNVNTREEIASSIDMRTSFVRKELKAAMDEKEIIDSFTPEELTNIFFGSIDRDLLNRRIKNENKRHNQVARAMIEKIAELIRIKTDLQ